MNNKSPIISQYHLYRISRLIDNATQLRGKAAVLGTLHNNDKERPEQDAAVNSAYDKAEAAEYDILNYIRDNVSEWRE